MLYRTQTLYSETHEVNRQAAAYRKAKEVLDDLKRNCRELTSEQYRTIKQTALDGKLEEAENLLWAIIREKARRKERDA